MSRFPTLARRWQRGTGVSGLLTAASHAQPGTVFLEDRFGSVLTYREAEDQACRFASWLRAAGVNRGDRVAIHVKNRVELAIILFGVARIGGIFVVLNAKLRPKGLAAILAQAEPTVLVVDDATEGNLGEIDLRGARVITIGGHDWTSALSCEPIMEEWTGCDVDAASLVFTSGSTGTPRGVVLSHDNITQVVGAIQDRLGYRAGDVIGGFLPLAFDYGLYQIFLAARSGAKLYLGDPEQVGPRLPQILRGAGVTVLPGVPSVYAALIALGRRGSLDLPKLRAITNTG